MSSPSKDESTSTTAFSIQNILSNKNYDGVWTTILNKHSLDSSHEHDEGISSPHVFKHMDWDSEALDMRMKHQMTGIKFHQNSKNNFLTPLSNLLPS